MTQRSRQEYTEAVRARYAEADRATKGRILDEYCRTTGCHRKAAIRALRRPSGRRLHRRGRRRRYDPALVPGLERLWEIGDRLCGKLLVAALPTLVLALERHGRLHLPPDHRRQPLTMSPATLDRLLRPGRARRGRQPYRTSPAASALKQQIPIRTWSDWAEARPGALQGDLVLHCGETLDGFYLTSLVGVDVATGWTELEAIWGIGHVRSAPGSSTSAAACRCRCASGTTITAPSS